MHIIPRQGKKEKDKKKKKRKFWKKKKRKERKWVQLVKEPNHRMVRAQSMMHNRTKELKAK